MVFWVGILISVLFAYFAIKKGFYETWALGFNIIISIYLAVFLGPVISGIIPMGTAVYNKIITTLAIAAASFLILQGTSYILITSQFNVPFPKIIDVVELPIVQPVDKRKGAYAAILHRPRIN